MSYKFLYKEITIPVEWNENDIPVIVIENKKLFSRLINELYYHMTGIEESTIRLLNKQNNNVLDKSKLILEPFSLNLNTKEFEKIVNDYILNTIKENKEIMDQQLIETYQFLSEKLIELPIDIELSDNFNQRNLSKLFPYTIFDDSDTIIEKIFNFMNIINELEIYETFIFVNIKQYLNHSVKYVV